MRFLRLLPLLLLPALFLGDTCVTHVDQQGPTGPWIVEVTNTGPDVQRLASVAGSVLDANGNLVLPLFFNDVCPYLLSPGEKGYFASPPVLDYMRLRPNAVQPFHLSFLSVSAQHPNYPAVTGVSFQVLGIYPEHKAILVQATNNSANTYHAVRMCALNIASSGDVREVSMGSPFLGVKFGPGDVDNFVVPFNSPLDGTFQFSADSSGSDIDTAIKSPPFDYVSKVIQTGKGRELHVVGEVTNTSGRDLTFAWFQAYLESSPTVRINGFVGTTDPTTTGIVSGVGEVAAGQKIPLAFTLPLDARDTTDVKIEGIVGTALPDTYSHYTLSPIPLKDVVDESTGSDTVRVSAMLSNPHDVGMNLSSLCFYARDARGKLIGGQCGSAHSNWIEPHGSEPVSQEVTLIGAGKAVSVDVVAYGHAGPKPIPVVPPENFGQPGPGS